MQTFFSSLGLSCVYFGNRAAERRRAVLSRLLPAAFAATYPELKALDVMGLTSPASAIISAVIFNALIIVALVPLAIRGVKYRPVGAAQLLRDNMLIYGLGGLVVPFVGIKAIDIALTLIGLA